MISATLRRTVRTLYAFSCGYCGVSETEVGSYLTIDHFVPLDAGGTDDVNNLIYACHACNLYKSAAWDAQSPPVLHPLRTDMAIHLAEQESGLLQSLTPEGARHIETLHLNRVPLVRRRKTLHLTEMAIKVAVQESERAKQLDAANLKREVKARSRKKRKH